MHLIVIVGPTAIGKTKTAIEVAKYLNCEIISADSRQIYKELNIGTAKPSAEELTAVKHYFVNHISILDYYNASMFENEAISLISKFNSHYLVVVGGSGLYIDALLFGIDDLPQVDFEIRNKLIDIYEKKGLSAIQQMLRELDPVSYERIDLNNPKRILKCLEITIQTSKPYSEWITGTKKQRNFDFSIFFLDQDREILYHKINSRIEKMFQMGLVDEVVSLSKFRHLQPLQTIGYKEIFEYLDNKITLTQAKEKIMFNTHKYARKQISWFRRYNSAYYIFSNQDDFTPKILKIIQSF